MEDDEVLDELVDEVLELDLVPLLGDRHQGRAEADRQVVRVHHVLVAERFWVTLMVTSIVSIHSIGSHLNSDKWLRKAKR